MKEVLDRLYEAIKHGDAEHQQWLKDKINSFLETESKPMKTYTEREVEVIAEMCHQANKVWCDLNGDDSQKDWADAEQ